MRAVAALIYWVIVALWLVILGTITFFYVRNPRTFGTTRLLLTVLIIDALRNLVENIYFGIYFGSQFGFLPIGLGRGLGTPTLLILPKLFNVLAGCLVLSILLLRWLPEAVREYLKAEQQAEQLKELAITDELTGLYNRGHLLRSAEIEMTRLIDENKPFSLLLFDIDLFKAVNDSHGHAAGDQVLAGVAKTFLKQARNTDVVARIGGEEFAMLLPGANLAYAHGVAERLRSAIAQQDFSEVAQGLQITISIGLAQGAKGCTISETHGYADAALYEAKKTGRNRVCAHGAVSFLQL